MVGKDPYYGTGHFRFTARPHYDHQHKRDKERRLRRAKKWQFCCICEKMNVKDDGHFDKDDYPYCDECWDQGWRIYDGEKECWTYGRD